MSWDRTFSQDGKVRPTCPSHERLASFYGLPVEALERLVAGKREPLDDEIGTGCALVELWDPDQAEPLDIRRQRCTSCPRLQWSKVPVTTRKLYAAASKHLAYHELGLAPDAAAYTEREKMAILIVSNERSKLQLGDMKGPSRPDETEHESN